MEKYSLDKIIKYAQNHLKQLSTKGIYAALLLFNAWSNKNTPNWAKNIILGALAYFLSPLDAIPDLTPFIGMTDDIGLMAFSLVTIACYIDNEVRITSHSQLEKILKGKVDESIIKEVNSWL